MLELATLISRHARYRSDATAVVFGNERLTYAQFGARVARSANLLRSLGIGKGDKVATVLANSREALDMGYVDEDGYLYPVDRKKDMIDSGGMKVYPKDVEEIAVRHPAIREVAVRRLRPS